MVWSNKRNNDRSLLKGLNRQTHSRARHAIQLYFGIPSVVRKRKHDQMLIHTHTHICTATHTCAPANTPLLCVLFVFHRKRRHLYLSLLAEQGCASIVWLCESGCCDFNFCLVLILSVFKSVCNIKTAFVSLLIDLLLHCCTHLRTKKRSTHTHLCPYRVCCFVHAHFRTHFTHPKKDTTRGPARTHSHKRYLARNLALPLPFAVCCVSVAAATPHTSNSHAHTHRHAHAHRDRG